MRPRALLAGLAILGPTPLVSQAPAAPDAELLVRTGGIWESNLDREAHPRQAYGGIVALGLELRDRPARPAVSLEYEIALHRYTTPSRWDRTSHHGRLDLDIRLGPGASWLLDGEFALDGSSEDRDLGNEYRGGTGIALRPASGFTVELAGAVRVKRYPTDSTRNATNPYLDLELKQRVSRGVRLAMGGRLEANVAWSARNSYRRATVEIGVRALPGGRDVVEAGVKLRRQRYSARRVEVEGRQAARRDTRLGPAVSWTHRFRQRLEISLGYEFEGRRSNDPAKAYDAHTISVVVTRRW